MHGWNIEECVEHQYANIYRTTDQIVVAEYKVEDLSIELEDAQEIQRISVDLCITDKTPILLVASRGFQPTKETREWAARKENFSHMSAYGFVINSLAQKILGNFFIQFHKPPVPVKLFTCVDEAYNWLKKYREPIGQE